MRKSIGHSARCANLFKDPKYKMCHGNVAYFIYYLFIYSLGAGPQKMLTDTLKWANTNLLFNLFKDCA